MSKIYSALLVMAFLGVACAVSGYKGYQLGVELTTAKWDAATKAATESIAKENIQIVKDRRKANHENQNRDDNALNAYGCERGWVRDRENCPIDSGKTGSGRGGLFQHQGHNRDKASGYNE